MNKFVMNFHKYRRDRLRKKHHRKRKEEIPDLPIPQLNDGQPFNPDLSVTTTEIN